MSKLYNVSSSPHVRSKLTTGIVMYDVILCLLPATVMGIWHFKLQALLVIAASIVSAMLAEFVFDYIAHRKNTLTDGSAIVTGLLLALCLPASVPLYIPCLGAVFAIIVAKNLFGGLGHNFMNPALAGRCFLLLSFSSIVADYTVDGYSSATPLAELKAGTAIVNADAIKNALIGNVGGTIGETCAIALIIGGIYLLVKHVISWRIPVVYIVVVFILTSLMRGNGFLGGVYEIFCGGLMLGAIFMATDYVTSPISAKGQIIFAIGCGILTSLIRVPVNTIFSA